MPSLRATGILHQDMVGEGMWRGKVLKRTYGFPSTHRSEARRHRLKPLFLLCTESMMPSSLAAALVEGGQAC